MTAQLDRRTRRDADLRRVATAAFFEDIFPALASAHGALVAAGIAGLNAPPLTVEVDGAASTVSRDGDVIVARAGVAKGALVVTLTPEQFSDWVQNQVTLNGLLVGRALRYGGGDLTAVSIWDSLWITLLEGWPTVDDGLAFRDRHGQPLDLRASFAPDDDPADIAHFLREAGYLHLRGWLPADVIGRISADMDRALPHYAEGDGKSWWATLNDGSRRCVRLQAFVEHSPVTADLLAGKGWDSLRRIIAATDDVARPAVEGRVIEALFKPVGVVSGPSDVSFHRDCHLGRHAYSCAHMTVGIALTPTSRENGLLRVIAGSHRVAVPVEIAKTRPYLPLIDVPTEAGDLTVHLSCTLHEATPPLLAERRVLYTNFHLAQPAESLPEANPGLSRLREGISDIHRREQRVVTRSA